MRQARSLLLSATLLLLAGCGQPTNKTVDTRTAAQPPSPSAPIVGTLPTPNFSDIGDYAILLESGGRLQVGDSLEAFEAAFPRPNLMKTAVLHELPNVAPGVQDPYTVAGWSMIDGNQGTGALVYQGRIALAMLQLEGLDDKAVQNQVSAYERAFESGQTVVGPRVRYWFWTSGTPQVLMLCAYQTDRGLQNLTIALGDAALMAVLRMSPDKAMQDRDTLAAQGGPGGSRTQ